MQNTLKRSLALLLVILTLGGILLEAVPQASAASYSYYQTSKSDVPIWSSASSSSTKIKTISKVGTVLKVVSSTTNSAGNLWYKLSDGYWVFSGNVVKHTHAYTGGICNGIGCGYEYPLTVTSTSGTFVVTNGSGAKIWSRPYSNNSTHIATYGYGTAVTVTAKTTNKDGNLWYKLSNGYWVFSGNVTQRFTISYNVNGGSGSYSSQTVLKGSKLTIHSAKPTRVGYIFQGWGTSSSDTSVDYKPGTSYSFTSDKTLYAIWKACSHSYSGGICDTCGYNYPYTTYSASGTYLVTNVDGAKIWSRPYSNKSTHIRTDAYGKALTITGKTTNEEGNLWYKLSDGYWVFSGNVARKLTISYHANGGTGAPGSQSTLEGYTLKLSSTKPSKVGYIFQGWGTSSSDTSVDYKPGSTYTFSSDKTLYAIWKACSHEYSGGICDICGYEYAYSVTSVNKSFQVTNADGATLYNRPYSNNSTKIAVKAKGTILSIVGQTKNQAGNLWYKTSDGYWVYSGNLTERVTVTFHANGGKNAPAAKTVLKGNSIILPESQPTRVGYRLKGWHTEKTLPANTSWLAKGYSYKVSKNITLYAIWEACDHSYSGGICTVCKYEYPITVTSLSTRYFQVTNADGAAIYDRPYSKQSTKITTKAKGAVLTIIGKTTNQAGNLWYQLSDGSWVYSGNLTQRFSVAYEANGGKNAPATQYFLKGKTLTISSAKPSRVGYIFQGWGTTASDTSVDYKPGDKYSASKSITLHAIWKACTSHSYSGGICKHCGYEYPLTVTAHSAYYVVTNAEGAKIWSRPYSNNSTHVTTSAKGTGLTVTHKTTNQAGNVWYKLSNGNWVFSGNVTRGYKLSYNANGGSGGPSSVIKASGTKITIPSTKPTRSNHTFLGWATSASGSVSYKPGASYTVKANATLYAVWAKNAAITANPGNQQVKAGSTATFRVSASGTGLNYQWQYRTSSTDTWANSSATGAGTATLNIHATITQNGYQYRCKVTDKYGNSVNSSAATLYVLGVKTQPTTQKVKTGKTATFSVQATGNQNSYQWQYKTSASGSWLNCTANGNQTSALKVQATTGKSSYYYRCRITDSAGNVVYTNTVRLYVLGVTSQPSDRTAAAGKTVKFSVEATGHNKTYQWQYRTSSAGEWKNSPATGNQTDALSVSVTATKNGYQYRCRITDSAGNVVYSNAATLNVK